VPCGSQHVKELRAMLHSPYVDTVCTLLETLAYMFRKHHDVSGTADPLLVLRVLLSYCHAHSSSKSAFLTRRSAAKCTGPKTFTVKGFSVIKLLEKGVSKDRNW
jgi:hypothetical protein